MSGSLDLTVKGDLSVMFTVVNLSRLVFKINKPCLLLVLV